LADSALDPYRQLIGAIGEYKNDKKNKVDHDILFNDSSRYGLRRNGVSFGPG